MAALRHRISPTRASVDSAKAQLEQTNAGTATAADIQSATVQLASAQAQLDALQHPSSADLSAAHSQVDQAQ